jgi:hypothetical protein
MTTDAGAASFRDPDGFVFSRDGRIYRHVNVSYQENFDHLISSGLYDSLVGDGLLIPHEEAGGILAQRPSAYKILKPEMVPFVSYPYEWCFSELKDAALLTLAVQRKALEHGMSLKDASAYNIQFRDGKPIFIDTLSFEKLREGEPWPAYRQFCQHFLAPLALISRTDHRLSELLKSYPDGVPLDLASTLLPFRTRLKGTLLIHIHLHAQSMKRYADRPTKSSKRKMTPRSLLGLLGNLQSAVRSLRWNA